MMKIQHLRKKNVIPNSECSKYHKTLKQFCTIVQTLYIPEPILFTFTSSVLVLSVSDPVGACATACGWDSVGLDAFVAAVKVFDTRLDFLLGPVKEDDM